MSKLSVDKLLLLGLVLLLLQFLKAIVSSLKLNFLTTDVFKQLCDLLPLLLGLVLLLGDFSLIIFLGSHKVIDFRINLNEVLVFLRLLSLSL